MATLPTSVKILKRNIDRDASRTWIVYEDNKPGGGIYAKVVTFQDINNIVSAADPDDYGTELLKNSTRIIDDSIYGAGPDWSVKEMSLDLYENFLSVAVITGSLPGDTQTRIHLGKLSIDNAGNLSWTLCATSPIQIPERLRAYLVIPGVDKEINMSNSASNKFYANGH